MKYLFTILIKFSVSLKDSHLIIKFDQKERLIRDDFASNRTSIILHYNRLKCKKCLKMFNDSLPTFEAKKSLSLALKLNIIEDLKQDISITNISTKDMSLSKL